MNRPCKELKRIARQNLSGRYGIPMAALLITGSIPMVAELPFSMLQKNSQPVSQTIIFYLAEFLISLLSVVLSAGMTQIHLSLARGKEYELNSVFFGFKNHPDRFILTGFLDLIFSRVTDSRPGPVSRRINDPAALTALGDHIGIFDAVRLIPGLVNYECLRQHAVVVFPQGA